MANKQSDPIGIRFDEELAPEASSPIPAPAEDAADSARQDAPSPPPSEAATPVPLLARVALLPRKTLDRLWGWHLFWFLVLVGFTSTAMGALVWLFSMPPVTDCRTVSNLAPERARLYCAQQAAQSGQVPEIEQAIRLVQDWPEDHPLYRQGLRFMEQWSQMLMQRANQEVIAGNLPVAIGLLSRIPSNSPLYNEAQTTIDSWDQGWERGQQLYAQAMDALKAQRWNDAEANAQRLGRIGDRYWSGARLDALMARVAAEKRRATSHQTSS